MASSSAVIIHEIADAIASKQNLYRSAYAADLKRLEVTHGHDAVVEALARLEARLEFERLGRRGSSRRGQSRDRETTAA
jgi:hypothetical protein